MSPRTKAQYEEIRKDRKVLIMQAAMKLFASQGFEKTSIQQIAEEAGISKGLPYNYFKNKEDLIRHIIIDGFNKMACYFDKNKDGIVEENELRYFITKASEIIRENTNYWMLYFKLVFQPEILALASDHFKAVMKPITTKTNSFFIKQGKKNPDAWTRYLLALLDGIGLHYIMDPESFPLDEVTQIVINQFCNSQ